MEKMDKLAGQLKNVEERVAIIQKVYEPEWHHAMVTLAHTVVEHKFDPTHKKEQSAKATKKTQTDSPTVVVTQAMHQWIDSIILAEDTARNQLRKHIRDLFAIATAKDPAKEANAKELEAAHLEAAREPRAPLRRPVERLPKKREEALKELSIFRGDLNPPPRQGPGMTNVKDLRDLQLLIESIIWVSTYDFTPLQGDRTKLTPNATEPADLPSGLWKRLIERYIDPDEGKSYKDVGDKTILGTQKQTFLKAGGFEKFSPEARLSCYFSGIIYPMVREGNKEIVAMFDRVGKI
jgi:hypothetical protein